MHRSEDGGMNWSTLMDKPVADECISLQFLDIAFAADSTVIAASEENVGSGSACKLSSGIYQSSDSGVS